MGIKYISNQLNKKILKRNTKSTKTLTNYTIQAYNVEQCLEIAQYFAFCIS